ncbi:hypothetical protein QAD02_002949 [Eretmocerus hayati]|uniref:Uncharacterized protein n=1 Tax=Eretmocerus hayati TaxID=131215 RepID=A0ACC2NKI6_9HYME|nr:hypothetical protein QAD02_002949 [Eretmocerus hayati]
MAGDDYSESLESESLNDPYGLKDVSSEYFEDFNSSQLSSKSEIKVPFEELLEESNDEDDEPDIMEDTKHNQHSNMSSPQAEDSVNMEKTCVQKVPEMPAFVSHSEDGNSMVDEAPLLEPLATNDEINYNEHALSPNFKVVGDGAASDPEQHGVLINNQKISKNPRQRNGSPVNSENISESIGSRSDDFQSDDESEIMQIGRTSLKLIKCSNFAIHIHNHKKQ